MIRELTDEELKMVSFGGPPEREDEFVLGVTLDSRGRVVGVIRGSDSPGFGGRSGFGGLDMSAGGGDGDDKGDDDSSGDNDGPDAFDYISTCSTLSFIPGVPTAVSQFLSTACFLSNPQIAAAYNDLKINALIHTHISATGGDALMLNHLQDLRSRGEYALIRDIMRDTWEEEPKK